MSNPGDIKKSITAAMFTRAKGSDLSIHMVNGDIISISPKAVPLPLYERDSVMDIADDSTGRLLQLNLEHVSSVECYMPKNGEPSQMQDLINEIRRYMGAEDKKDYFNLKRVRNIFKNGVDE